MTTVVLTMSMKVLGRIVPVYYVCTYTTYLCLFFKPITTEAINNKSNNMKPDLYAFISQIDYNGIQNKCQSVNAFVLQAQGGSMLTKYFLKNIIPSAQGLVIASGMIFNRSNRWK